MLRVRVLERKQELFGANFLRIFLTLTPTCPGAKKFLPITAAAGKRTSCGRPRFRGGRPQSERFSKSFVQKKFALLSWSLILRKGRSSSKQCYRELQLQCTLSKTISELIRVLDGFGMNFWECKGGCLCPSRCCACETSCSSITLTGTLLSFFGSN